MCGLTSDLFLTAQKTNKPYKRVMEKYSYTITTRKGQILDMGTVCGTYEEARKRAEDMAAREPMYTQADCLIKVMKIG